MTDDSTQTAEAAATTIRAIVPPPEGDATGLRAYVTGEVGFEADRSEAVKSIDETLLLVTCTVLILLLLAIYRSPLMALVPIFVVGIAYIVAGGLTYGWSRAGVTDRERADHGDPDRAHVRRGHRLLPADRRPLPRRAAARPRTRARRWSARASAPRPAILSAGAIVDRRDARARGRRLQRHARDGADPRARHRGHGRGRADAAAGAPERRSAGARSGPRSRAWSRGAAPSAALWRAVGRLVSRRPATTAGVVTAILLVGALGSLGGREPLDFSEAFRTPPESVAGKQVICDRFIPGRAAPIEVVMDFAVTGRGDQRAHDRARDTDRRRCTSSAASVPTQRRRNPSSRWRRRT